MSKIELLKLASDRLRLSIKFLEAYNNAEVDEILNNLKHEEEKLDSIIMNREDSNS